MSNKGNKNYVPTVEWERPKKVCSAHPYTFYA